jgi:hypothetical protein
MARNFYCVTFFGKQNLDLRKYSFLKILAFINAWLFGFKMCPKCVQKILIKTAFIFKNKNPVASKLSKINSKLNFIYKMILK